MGGLDKDTPTPTEIKLHQKSRLLEVAFTDGSRYELSYELLRVYSPSAEVRGHGPGQETLQVGKRDIEVQHVEPVGMYATQPPVSDAHRRGIYSGDNLEARGAERDRLWQEYLDRMQAAGASREAADNPAAPKQGGCGSGGCGHH